MSSEKRQEPVGRHPVDWHPVGLSHSLEMATSTGTRLDGKELVVWRDSSGVAHVWEDRCPHRGMRLSFGFVRGDHIACLYHGWQYDTAGQCRYVPAHPDLEVPQTIKVPVYRTMEKAGMIWTQMAEGSDEVLLAPDAGMTVPLRSIYVDCAPQVAIAALAAFELAPFAASEPSKTNEPPKTQITALSPALYAVSAGIDRLLIGIQSLSDDRTALHIVIAGAPEIYRGAGQAHFLAFCLALRHRIEHPPKPVFGSFALASEGRA